MSKLDYYIHDQSEALRLAINGDLSGPGVVSLDRAWRTGSSVLCGRALIIDLVSVCDADEYGRNLLLAWHRIGAQIIARSHESSAFAERIAGAPIPLHPKKPSWRRRLSTFLLRRSSAAAGNPARATTTGTSVLAVQKISR